MAERPGSSGRPPLVALVWPGSNEQELAAAAMRVRDWQALIAQAGREGLVGLLAAALCAVRPSGVPDEAMAELGRLRGASARRALYMAGSLLRILELLEAHGIEAMPVKGPALAQDVYGDATLRTFCDLDVLVRPRDLWAARLLLLGNGFVDAGRHNERIIGRRRRSESEVHLRSRRGEPLVDLHWQLTVGYSPHAISTARLLAGSRTLDLLGRPVRAPGSGDQLLLTALHGARHHWATLEQRLAVAVQVLRLPPAVWSGLCSTARELGCLRRLTVGVAHACSPFAVPVPAAILDELSRDRTAPRYAAYLRRAACSGASSQPHHGAPSGRDRFASVWWRVRSEDDLTGTIDHLAWRSLLPGPEDWDAVQLPAALDWAYWLVRPPRLLYKHAPRAKR